MQDNDGGGAATPTKSSKKKEFLKKMSNEYEARGLTEVNVDNL